MPKGKGYPDSKKNSAKANPQLSHENTEPPGAKSGPISSGRRVHTSSDG